MIEPLDGVADQHAHALLRSLGLRAAPRADALHPALAWRRAGLMTVTGHADGPGLVAPVALVSAADGALAALQAIAPDAVMPASGAALLGERARLLGLRRRGAISANGSCRLLPARDGRFALNLPRPDDWDMLPALVGGRAETWADVARAAREQPLEGLIAQGRLLGLAIAADAIPATPETPLRVSRLGAAVHRRGPPLVVDLSSLWAGPLATSLLHCAGARVVKVESRRRPDGARAGPRKVYDLLNHGKQSVALDFADAADIALLRRIVARADIVVEASRPRALARLGIDAEAVARRGGTWLSITAHGRDGDAADWIGFGDDAAVAGGLAARMARAWGASMFAGDAIADPLTGITAALGAWASWRSGGGQVVSVALAEVVAHAAALCGTADVQAWQRIAEADGEPLLPLRSAPARARPLGTDTAAIAAAFGDEPRFSHLG